MQQPKVIVLHEQAKEYQKEELQDEIQNFKMTNHLLKQISFNTTVNRFEYLQELLHKQHISFSQKVTNITNQQKEIIKQTKQISKQIKEIKMPSINYIRLQTQVQEINNAMIESQKYLKLSQGMLTALSKLEQEVTQIQANKISNKIYPSNSEIQKQLQNDSTNVNF